MLCRLFPIALRGAGTAEVESFPSYIHRISYEHGLYVGELLRFVYRHGMPEIGNTSDFPRLPNYINIADFLRPSKTTIMLVRLFEVMTRQPLQSSILWFLEHSLGRSSGEVHNSFRWCPECFAETEAQGEQAYFKLIWHMEAISACPTHKTPLLEKCPYCDHDQKTYIKKHPVGSCQMCGVSLSKRKEALKPSDIVSSWECKGSDILELFTDLAQTSQSALPNEGVRASLEFLFDYYWDAGREGEFYNLLSRDELLAILHSQKHISLKIARRIAFRLGVSLFVLMSGNAHHSSAVLNSDWVCELPKSFMVSSKVRRDHKAVLKRVKRIIEKSDEPPSLNTLAKQARVSSGYLEHRYPVLVKSVVARHQDHLAHTMLRKRYYAQAAALRYFVDEKYNAHTRSRRQAYKKLKQETGLPKSMLLRAIQSAYLALQ